MTLITQWKQWIKNAVGRDSKVEWNSLLVNRRKPYTWRAWTMLPDGNRVCLHRFEKCNEDEAFAHPHGWPAEFLVLQGSYKEWIWYDGQKQPVLESIYTPGSWHKIDNPLTWHRVQPLEDNVYTIMINGAPYDNPLSDVRTTKGKDLEKMTPDQLNTHLTWFGLLL